MKTQQYLNILSNLRADRYKNHESVHILSLDWDAWTGDMFNNKCCGFCGKFRSHPIGRGKLDNRWGDGRDLWYNPFSSIRKVNLGSPLFTLVAECHADLSYIVGLFDIVTNVDYHQDQENDDIICCGSWAKNLKYYVHIHHPIQLFKHYSKTLEDPPDVIFMCLSSPWTPRNTDKNFFNFVKIISGGCKETNPIFIGHRQNSLKKRYIKYTQQ